LVAGDPEIYAWLVKQGLLEVCFDLLNNTNTSQKDNKQEKENTYGAPKVIQEPIDLMEIIVSFVTLDCFYSELSKGDVRSSSTSSFLLLSSQLILPPLSIY
jgi:hypothetical protein